MLARSSGSQGAGSVTLVDESSGTSTAGTAEARPLHLRGWNVTQDTPAEAIAIELLDGTGGTVIAREAFEKTAAGALSRTTFVPTGSGDDDFIEVASGKLVAKFVGAGKGSVTAYYEQQ